MDLKEYERLRKQYGVKQHQKVEGWEADAARPKSPLSRDWSIDEEGGDGCAYLKRNVGGEVCMKVIASGSRELDGKRWLHVSVSRPAKLPSWEDLKEVKDLFVGRDKVAYQVVAMASKHVNIHATCLHLWHCLDGDPLPDFTRGGRSI